MARQLINIGTIPGDGKGDPARDVGLKLNAMTAELYEGLGSVPPLASEASAATGVGAGYMDPARSWKAMATAGLLSALNFAAAGDGVASDLSAWRAAEAASPVVYAPAGSVFNLGSETPAKLVQGAGAVKIGGVVLDGIAPALDVLRSNLVWAPPAYAPKVLGATSTPATTNYFNVVLAPNSIAIDTSKSIWRSIFVGALVGENFFECERSEFIGQGAARFARYSNRNSGFGSLGWCWLGAESHQYLADTYHDFYIFRAGDVGPVILPGQPGWDFMGLETRNPGIGATIAAFNSWASSRSDCETSVAFGRDAALHPVKTSNVVAIGYQSLTNGWTPTNTVAVGARSFRDGLFIEAGVAVGNSAAVVWQSGVRNVIVGANGAVGVVTGDNATIVGAYTANGLTSVSNSVLMGYQSGGGHPGTSLTNALAIQYGVANKPLVGGDFSAKKVGVNLYKHELAYSIGVLQVQGVDAASAQMSITGWGGVTGNWTGLRIQRSLGAAGAYTIVNNNTIIGHTEFDASDGTGFATVARMRVQMDGGTLGSGNMPAIFNWWVCPQGSATLVSTMTLRAAGLNLVTGAAYFINGLQVVGARKTGWAVPTGTATRTAFDTTTVTLPQLAERVKAVIDDLHATAGHGLLAA